RNKDASPPKMRLTRLRYICYMNRRSGVNFYKHGGINMAAQYEYEWEMSPLHEYELEADRFFGRAFKRLGRFAKGLARRAAPLLKRLAPIAARVVAGAIPGVGAIAGPLAGRLVGALTQEQQQELEAVLHEAGAMHPEYEAVHPEWEGVHP